MDHWFTNCMGFEFCGYVWDVMCMEQVSERRAPSQYVLPSCGLCKPADAFHSRTSAHNADMQCHTYSSLEKENPARCSEHSDEGPEGPKR